jgi:hypothetical protein
MWAASAATLAALTGLGMASPEPRNEPNDPVELADASASAQPLPASLAIAALDSILAAKAPTVAAKIRRQ